MSVYVLGMPMNRSVLIRVFADILLVQLALMAAFAFRFLLIALDPGDTLLWGLADRFMDGYFRSSWLVGLVALPLFAANGFYTRGRFYRSRLKVLMVTQAVAVQYLLIAAVVLMANNWFRLPRGVLLMAGVLTVMMVAGARVWSVIWTELASYEGRLLRRRQLSEITVRTVLVIGGGGYIGSALLPRLLKAGYRVRLLDLMLFGNDPIKGCIDHPNLEIIKADFRQIDYIVQAVRGVDAVIHLGGIVGDPACSIDEDLTVDVNLVATRVIAEIARGEGVQRFVFASTCSVYGAGESVLDESSELNPVSLYARTKLASEHVLLRMAGDDFAPVILRFGTIYGLSGRTRFDLVINLLSAKAKTDGEITVFGGDQWRPFVHVDDAARAVFLALSAPLQKVRDQIMNVGSNGQNYTINQVAEIIKELSPGSSIVQKGNDSDVRNYRVNFDKISHTLGFKPEWTVERGVQQVADALESGAVTDYRDNRYSNLKSLTEDHSSRFFRQEQNWQLVLLDDKSEPTRGPNEGDSKPKLVVSNDR